MSRLHDAGALRFMTQKLRERRIWERVARERLAEPVHLNLASLFVAIAGSLRSRIYFDLLPRQANAFALLTVADQARESGLSKVTIVEFGVANGAGLLNLARLASLVTEETGVAFSIIGFDSGTGMPPPVDYRDHPEFYRVGDFPMQRPEDLRRKLPTNVELIIGDITDTLPAFIDKLSPASPVAYVVVDVDYYSSTTSCLDIFIGAPEVYLPTTIVYLDDIQFAGHNRWQGELLAVEEFNERHEMRKITPYNFLRASRLFKRPVWIDLVYTLHVLDHSLRNIQQPQGPPAVLKNPYL
jgi:hypothetical protein